MFFAGDDVMPLADVFAALLHHAQFFEAEVTVHAGKAVGTRIVCALKLLVEKKRVELR